MEARQTARFFVLMSRSTRLHFPGAAFHITSRTQGHEHWFTERIRARVEEIIIEGFATSDARLIAATVMPNHLHIVARQGMHRLGWTMQPILRRIALLVQRAEGIEGHVFERPFHAKVCDTADYLRNAIVYTNVNPNRAGLCDNDGKYACSSHDRFLRGADRYGCEPVAGILQLFCDGATSSLHDRCKSYQRFVEWRLTKDRADAAGDVFTVAEPRARYGEIYFVDNYIAWKLQPRLPLRDLRDTARDVLREVAPALDLAQLKGRFVSRPVSVVRRQVIAALLQAGYRCKSVADFLQVSDSLVSAVASGMRYSSLGLSGNVEGSPQ